MIRLRLRLASSLSRPGHGQLLIKKTKFQNIYCFLINGIACFFFVCIRGRRLPTWNIDIDCAIHISSCHHIHIISNTRHHRPLPPPYKNRLESIRSFFSFSLNPHDVSPLNLFSTINCNMVITIYNLCHDKVENHVRPNIIISIAIAHTYIVIKVQQTSLPTAVNNISKSIFQCSLHLHLIIIT